MAEAALRQVHAWRIECIAVALQSRVHVLARSLRDAGLDAWLRAPVASHILGVRPPPVLCPAIATVLREAGVITTLRRGCVRLAPHLHVGVEPLPRVAQLLRRVANAR